VERTKLRRCTSVELKKEGGATHEALGLHKFALAQSFLEYCTLPFAKFSRRERYCGDVLAVVEVLVQEFVYNLN